MPKPVTRIGKVAVGGFYARRPGRTAPVFKCVAITDRWIQLESLPSPEQRLFGRAPFVPDVVSVPVAAWRSLHLVGDHDPRVMP